MHGLLSETQGLQGFHYNTLQYMYGSKSSLIENEINLVTEDACQAETLITNRAIKFVSSYQ